MCRRCLEEREACSATCPDPWGCTADADAVAVLVVEEDAVVNAQDVLAGAVVAVHLPEAHLVEIQQVVAAVVGC